MRQDDASGDGGGGAGFHELFDSVRRSIAFRTSAAAAAEPPASPLGAGAGGGIGERISSCLRKSRGMGLLGLISKSPSPPRRLLPPTPVSVGGGGAGGGEENPPIRWRKGEMIGSGAFGQVYLGMNLDTGELLAVKQVLIGSSNATREKAQAHIKELEEEVKLLKNLSHPNIVRYLGTVREEDTLNILLEFVPGGSIQSLLGKLGSFPEAVIRKYTKQLLQGLEYLHNNAIIHRDIKGANILVDNKGCIKLADFGASKQVAKLGQLPDGRKVAVKKLIECRLTNKGEDFTREVQVISKLMHPTLVELLFYCQEGGEWKLVYEYMQKKSLDLYIFGDTRLRSSVNWARRREIIRGIAVGVAYLHDMQVIHRDLKPSNILLESTKGLLNNMCTS